MRWMMSQSPKGVPTMIPIQNMICPVICCYSPVFLLLLPEPRTAECGSGDDVPWRKRGATALPGFLRFDRRENGASRSLSVMLTELAVGLEPLSAPDAAGVVRPKLPSANERAERDLGPPWSRRRSRNLKLTKNCKKYRPIFQKSNGDMASPSRRQGLRTEVMGN